MSRGRKTVLVVLVMALFLPFLVMEGLQVWLYGGPRLFLLSLKARPDPDSDSVKRGRATLEARIDDAFRGIFTSLGFVHDQASQHDVCYDGRNALTAMPDGFAHRCTLRVTRYYGFDGDFRATMLGFEKSVMAAGWDRGLVSSNVTPVDDMAYYMKNYYDVRTNVTVDQIAAPLGYNENGLRLRLAWAENKTRYLTNLDVIRAVDVSAFYQQKNFQDVSEIFNSATRDHRYVLAVAIEGHYFED